MYMESFFFLPQNQIHIYCFLTSDCYRTLTTPHLLSIGKKNAKKRLSQDQAKDDAGQQPEVTGTDSPPGLGGLSLPQKVPLIQPKTEPEEQESKWTNSYNMWFSFSHFPETVC